MKHTTCIISDEKFPNFTHHSLIATKRKRPSLTMSCLQSSVRAVCSAAITDVTSNGLAYRLQWLHVEGMEHWSHFACELRQIVIRHECLRGFDVIRYSFGINVARAKFNESRSTLLPAYVDNNALHKSERERERERERGGEGGREGRRERERERERWWWDRKREGKKEKKMEEERERWEDGGRDEKERERGERETERERET